MSGTRLPDAASSAMRMLALLATLGSGVALADGPAQLLAESARVTAPPLIAFDVPDVTVTTEPITGATTIAFDTAFLSPGRVLRISVKADNDLQGPDGAALPASRLSWRTTAATNGVGTNGVLSRTTYVQVFQGNIEALSGGVDMTWTLDPQGPHPRAGVYEATLRWRFESVIP